MEAKKAKAAEETSPPQEKEHAKLVATKKAKKTKSKRISK